MSEKTTEYQTTNEAIHKQTNIGLHLLKESILEVLYIDQLNGDGWVKAAHVRTRIGIPKSQDESDMGNASVRHILLLLKDEGKVEQSGNKVHGDSKIQSLKTETKQVLNAFIADFRITLTVLGVGGNSDSRLPISFVKILKSFLQKCVSLISMFTINNGYLPVG